MTKTVVNLTPAATKLLGHISKGVNTREALAKKVRGTVASVNGSITALKRAGVVELDEEGTIKQLLKMDQIEIGGAVERTPRKNSKAAKARTIFNRMHGQGKTRAQILPKLVALGLTDKGASTYYQTMKKAADEAVAA